MTALNRRTPSPITLGNLVPQPVIGEDGAPRIAMVPAAEAAVTAPTEGVSAPPQTDRIDEVEQVPRLVVGRPPAEYTMTTPPPAEEVVSVPVIVDDGATAYEHHGEPDDAQDPSTVDTSTVDGEPVSTMDLLSATGDYIDELATAIHNDTEDDNLRRLMGAIVQSNQLQIQVLENNTAAIQSIGEMQQWMVNAVGNGLAQLQRIVGSGNPMKMMGELRKMAAEMQASQNGGG